MTATVSNQILRVLLGSVFLLIVEVQSSAVDSVDQQLATVAKTLSSQLHGRSLRRLAVSGIVSLNGEQTSLTRYMADKLATQLVAHSGTLDIIDRSQIATILAEHKMSESGLLDPTTVTKLGKLAGVDAVLVGVLTTFSSSVDLNVKVLEVETAKIHAALSSRIDGPEISELTGSSNLSRPVQLPDSKSIPATSSSAKPFYESDLIRVEVESIGVSERRDSITFTLSLQSRLASEVLYLGAVCCYAEWLKVVDNNGQRWESDQHNLTRIPTDLDTQFISISPGDKIHINARIRPANDGSTSRGGIPTSISITGAMLRRTADQQRLAEGSRVPERRLSRPFTFGISEIAVGRPRARLGLTLKRDTTLTDLARVGAKTGLVVQVVQSGGPAQTAGIQAGDVLEKIDGVVLSNFEQLGQQISGKQPGDQVVVLVNRSGARLERSVRLGN